MESLFTCIIQKTKNVIDLYNCMYRMRLVCHQWNYIIMGAYIQKLIKQHYYKLYIKIKIPKYILRVDKDKSIHVNDKYMHHQHFFDNHHIMDTRNGLLIRYMLFGYQRYLLYDENHNFKKNIDMDHLKFTTNYYYNITVNINKIIEIEINNYDKYIESIKIVYDTINILESEVIRDLLMIHINNKILCIDGNKILWNCDYDKNINFINFTIEDKKIDIYTGKLYPMSIIN